MKRPLLLSTLLVLFACRPTTNHQTNEATNANAQMDKTETFAHDYEILHQQTDAVLLERDSMKVAVVGDYQARVMTSTANGWNGLSYGWINHDLIRSGDYQPHINAFGGEERFWLGPEGGQYALFFQQDDPFDLEHWQTPGAIDTMTYELIDRQPDRASYQKDFELTNYSGTTFRIKVERTIRLLNAPTTEQLLGVNVSDLQWVGYETVNRITNTGDNAWTKSTGAPSIWLLGMMKASPETTVIIPYRSGGAGQVNAAYFGEAPADRLVKTDSVLFFTGDARYRSKIGIPPGIVQPIAGSYDAQRQTLTVVHFDYDGATEYVNSMWELQEFPYKGDVVNAYNDGPNETGDQLGKFYELETSSPALFLPSGKSGVHIQRTFHFEGENTALERLCRKLFGVELPK